MIPLSGCIPAGRDTQLRKVPVIECGLRADRYTQNRISGNRKYMMWIYICDYIYENICRHTHTHKLGTAMSRDKDFFNTNNWVLTLISLDTKCGRLAVDYSMERRTWSCLKITKGTALHLLNLRWRTFYKIRCQKNCSHFFFAINLHVGLKMFLQDIKIWIIAEVW